MALVKCKECGHQISKRAKACQNCGGKNTHVSPITKFFVCLLILALIPALLPNFFYTGSGPATVNEIDAQLAARKAAALEKERKVYWPEKPTLPTYAEEASLVAYLGDPKNLKPRVIGYTNLPDGTELSVTLSRKEIGYSASAKAVVTAGKFETDIFTAFGNMLPPGEYQIMIGMAAASFQPEPAQSALGENGENLRGKYVKENKMGGKVIEYVEQVQLGDGATKEADDQYRAAVKANEVQLEAGKHARIPAAQYACREFVKGQLHDPDSARFERTADYPARVDGDIYIVEVNVRAKNGFNAMRNTVFLCKTMPMGGDRWSPLQIKQVAY